MTRIEVSADPVELGFDPGRLARIDQRLARFVDEGRLPGWQVVVSRHGQVAHASSYGLRDVAANRPIEPDTLYRIYSMTKPVTAVAAMLLLERGELLLTDPIATWLPEFAEPRVYLGGSDLAPVTRPATEPIRVRHLLTHMSGLGYGFLRGHPVSMMYLNAGLDELGPAGTGLARTSLAELTRRWAALPLTFDPGQEWQYSVGIDVLGRLIEVICGQPFDEFVQQHILDPLGMSETFFTVPEQLRDRVAVLYQAGPGGIRPAGSLAEAAFTPGWPSGGAGLTSTPYDYWRFTQMLCGGGQVDGVRLLAPGTVAMMRRNYLPNGQDLSQSGRPLYAESPMYGVGFGLGMSVTLDPAKAGIAASVGDFGWGGLASTVFTVDPALDLTYEFYTQLVPSSTLPIRPLLRQLVHQAIVE
ncbi:MAG TPA: serine hydrolase domain-containing protein [Jatrophihabitans sp.]|nr:serine hydrolase domain-containing protein [Jatrophihabitans sp.]